MATSPPADRGERRREQTRRQLTRAARALIAERGVAGVKIGDLTETADVGRGSFYNHFASKEELVDAVVREMLAEVAAGSRHGLEGETDPAVRACVANRRFVALAAEDPDTARLAVNLAHGDTVFGQAVGPYARAELDRGLASGRFRIADVDVAMLVLTGSAFAVMRAILEDRAPADAVELHAEAVLTLFGIPAGEARAIARRPLPGAPGA